MLSSCFVVFWKDCICIPSRGYSAALGFGLGATICVVTEDARDLEDMVDRTAAIAFQEGFCQGGDRFLVTAGVPLGTFGATNLLRITAVSESRDKRHLNICT
ncbi:pyruvate kinase alpha/beta domain-containing protein [Bartonella vinsonii]|uniref:pyruvate kinase alpha/beta domain-containing protein n=1 Tax=Bartonella vinsonii TaxID=33047 RepID=UPI0003A66C42